MYKITKKQELTDNVILMDIQAPDVAKAAKAGQFILLRIDEQGERIPLTIADYDDKNVTIVFQIVGKTTTQLSNLDVNDSIKDFTGPLGEASEIENFGNVILVGGGLGIAPLFPIARSLHKAGNKVYFILGARNEKLLFWIEKFEQICEEVIIATDDGSKGLKGNVVNAMEKYFEDIKPDRVITIGPPIMMKFVSKFTEGKIKTIASINSIMIDGIGMCGGCRIKVDDKIKFACVDGPDFDAHKVDFEDFINRNRMWQQEEKHACRLTQK